jgi:hypothetical protein
MEFLWKGCSIYLLNGFSCVIVLQRLACCRALGNDPSMSDVLNEDDALRTWKHSYYVHWSARSRNMVMQHQRSYMGLSRSRAHYTEYILSRLAFFKALLIGN